LYFLKLAVGAKLQIGELLLTLCQPQSASTVNNIRLNKNLKIFVRRGNSETAGIT